MRITPLSEFVLISVCSSCGLKIASRGRVVRIFLFVLGGGGGRGGENFVLHLIMNNSVLTI